MNKISKSKYKTYTITTTIGSVGDQETDWWTEEDWIKHREYVERCRQNGTLGNKVKYKITLLHNPILDEPSLPKKLNSLQYTLIDFSNGR